MKRYFKKHRLTSIGILVLAILVIPIMTYISKPHDSRSRASAASILSFSPTSSTFTPIQKKVGDPVALDVMLNPGTNAISILKLDVQYDPNYFLPGSNPIVINTSAFTTIVEGPVVNANNGEIIVTLSVGTDPTKAIKTSTKIATINLLANAKTNGGTVSVTFGSQSQAFSVAPGDQATQNVLATAMPAYFNIAASTGGGGGGGPTTSPSNSPSVIIDNPTDFPTQSVSLAPGDIAFNYSVFLHGIGNSGDSTNPNGSSFSNKNPNTYQRNVDITVVNSSGQEIVSTTGTMSYDSTHGDYTGSADLGTGLPPGIYTVKLQSQSYLRKLVPGVITVTSSSTSFTLPAVTLTAGDINGDNQLNIIDYNILLGCYSDILAASFCPSQNQSASDLTDDGAVNQFDYNLFLREIQVQAGQ